MQTKTLICVEDACYMDPTDNTTYELHLSSLEDTTNGIVYSRDEYEIMDDDTIELKVF